MNPEDFKALKDVFISETEEVLKILENNLLLLEAEMTAEQRLELVKEMFRSAHSIKGSALMFGFEKFSKAAHRLEDSFAILRDKADLSAVSKEVVTMVLSGVDCLKNILQQINTQETDDNREKELEAIAHIKTYLESQYGTLEDPNESADRSIKPATLKIIFERDLPPVFSQLEAELSQVTLESLPQTMKAINKIYLQLSGVAGMLQLPEFADITESLRELIERPEQSIEEFQSMGWAIAQNLRTAQEQIVAGKPIKVEAIAHPNPSATSETSQTNSTETLLSEQITSEQILEKQQTKSPPPPTAAPSPPLPTAAPTSPQRSTIRVELESLTELVNLVGELVINRTNLERQESLLRGEVKRLRRSIFDLKQSGVQLREEYDHLSVRRSPQSSFTGSPPTLNDGNGSSNFIPPIADAVSSETLADSRMFKVKHGHRKHNHFDALELDEYSEFHTTAQRVIESSQTIASSATKIEDLGGQFEGTIEQLRRITNNLRSRIMQLRVVPFSNVVDLLPRLVRDLCHTQNKEVNLRMLGRDTKIDETHIPHFKMYYKK